MTCQRLLSTTIMGALTGVLAATSASALVTAPGECSGRVRTLWISGYGGDTSREMSFGLVTAGGNVAFRIGANMNPAIFSSYAAALLKAHQTGEIIRISYVPGSGADPEVAGIGFGFDELKTCPAVPPVASLRRR